MNEAQTLEELQIWERVLKVPFYERGEEGQVLGLDLLKYLELATFHKMDPTLAFELLISARQGMEEAFQRKELDDVSF